MFTSQKFKDARTGAIVTQFNISEIQHFDEYNGPLQAGDFDIKKPEPLKVGDRVKVSNGKPKPPARFNRKLAEWGYRNYTGTIKAIEPPRDYQPRGAVQIEPDGRNIPGCISFVNHVMLGSCNIERIESKSREEILDELGLVSS